MTGATIHVLSQYLWPDDAPTGLYAEQLADSLAAAGAEVRLVGGQGCYREGRRPPPRTPITRLAHYEGRRGALLSTAREYESVREAFRGYVRARVQANDVVVVTSAPPTTLFLHRAIRARRAIGVYWLQDYYPQLIRGVWDAPLVLRRLLDRLWRGELARWPQVVKAAGNLGYAGENAVVIRNWNTLELGERSPARPRTALYSGNLGWGHDLPAFLELCRKLHDDGYEVTVRGDGPGMQRLPGFVRAEPPLVETEALVRSYWEAEVHLVAGHPRFPDAVFPSKFWNARATGRPVLASGFVGEMAEELKIALHVDYRHHLPRLTQLVLGLLTADVPRRTESGRSRVRTDIHARLYELGCRILLVALRLPLLPDALTRFAKIWLRHARIARHLARGGYDSIVDGGASIGEFAAIARWACPQARLLCVEPHPPSAARLRQRGFSVVEAALWRERGTSTLAQPTDAITSSSLLAPVSAERPAWTVATVRLDGLGIPGRRVLVKLDLQGAEPQALEGMGELWERCAGLLLEVSYGPSGSYEPLRALLADRGFFEAATLNELESESGVTEADKLWLRHAEHDVVQGQ